MKAAQQLPADPYERLLHLLDAAHRRGDWTSEAVARKALGRLEAAKA